VLRPGTGGGQGRPQVAKHLLGLCGDVDDIRLFNDKLRASTVVDAEPAGKLNSSCMAEV
jgi:hypothetical protein